MLQRLLDSGKPPRDAIRSLYVRCLSREPSAEESAKLVQIVGDQGSFQPPLEDVFWALLNSREFLFNH